MRYFKLFTRIGSLRVLTLALALGALALGFVAWHGAALPGPSAAGNSTAQASPMPALRGEAAREYLEQQGLYSSLAETMRAARYSINWAARTPLAGGIGAHEADNAAQGLRAYFTPRGVQVMGRADSPQWQMGLQLRAAGRTGQMLDAGQAKVSATGQRASLWRQLADAQAERRAMVDIEEWYENREDGLEQGFTLTQRLAGAGDEVCLEMELTGELQARIEGEGLELTGAGAHLRYAGLRSWDATGRALATRLELSGRRVRLLVDDAGALYPLTIDPTLNEIKKLTDSAGTAGDQFGQYPVISGDTVLVGAPNKNSNTGSVFIFERNQGGANNWGLLKTLNGSGSEFFGFSLAVSGDTLVVGAPLFNSGNGRVYIFERNLGGANNWGFVKNLASPGFYGAYVSISNDTIVVGARDANATGQGFIYDRNNGGANNWGLVKVIAPSDAQASDSFGIPVEINGDTIVAGVESKNGNVGAGYVFDRNNGGANNWGQSKILTIPGTQYFGASATIFGDLAVFGESHGCGSSPGHAYIFARNQGGANNWGLIKTLNGMPNDGFGSAAKLVGDALLIGADAGNCSGIAEFGYLFARNQGGVDNWGLVKTLAGSDVQPGDAFGGFAGMSSSWVVMGAVFQNQIKGAAYIFSLNSPPSITAVPASVVTGTPASNTIIANVSDPDQALETLSVTVNGGASATLNGITVSNITVNTMGVVKANLVAVCGSSAASFTLAVTDSLNTTTNATLNVTPIDTPPTITCPTNIFLGTTGNSAVASWPTPTVSDNCPGVGAPVCTPASGSNFNVGVTTVTCTVTDAANNPASCSFTVTVNRVSGTATDPLACTGPGNTIQATLVITNNGNVNQTVADTTTFTNLVGVPNTCTISPNVGTCAVTNGSLTYNASLTPGQTVTITYLTQVNDLALTGQQVCTNNSVAFNGGPPLAFSVCDVIDCPTQGPGAPFPAAAEGSDQKAGSVLIYNVYTSGATSGNTQNTRVNLTNTHPKLPAFVHLFFVAEGCSVADSYLCLTGNQTASFLSSDLDPGTTGYLVAVAVDGVRGCPVNFNYLIGDEYVKFSSGHAANLGAEAFSALSGGLPACDGNSVTATLNFDGVSYNRVPAVLALSNVGSRADGNDTMLILNRIGGNLGIGASTLSTLFGILYDDAENALSFSVSGNCQLRNSISNNFPRTTPRFESFIPAGRTGWAKVFSQTGTAGITGAAINFNANAGASAGAFNQGHNLHVMTLTTASYVIPVFPPSC